MQNKNFLVTNIFFLADKTALSVRDIKAVNTFEKEQWSLFINGKFDRDIKFIGVLRLKGATKNIEETLLETKQDLSDFKNIDFKVNTIMLVKKD
ncbi:MAG: hypothetical protein JWO44_187 [Bacteroidetes bacterium]|nr:hypothetical protein [Bacteroidota bacterium]